MIYLQRFYIFLVSSQLFFINRIIPQSCQSKQVTDLNSRRKLYTAGIAVPNDNLFDSDLSIRDESCQKLKSNTGSFNSELSSMKIVADKLLSNGLKGGFKSDVKDQALEKEIALGIVMLNNNYFDQATYHFETITRRIPTSIAGYVGRAASSAATDHLDTAIDHLTTAINIDPKMVDLYERRVEVHIRLNQYNSALSDIKTILSLSPNNAKAYFLRATIHYLQKDFRDAEADYKTCLKSSQLKSENENLHYSALLNLGISMFSRGRIRNAIEVFKEILVSYPNDYDAIINLAQAYKELGDSNKSSQYFESIETKNNAFILQSYGSLLYESGKSGLAVDKFNKCIELEPNNKICRLYYGLSLFNHGKIFECVKEFTKVIVYDNFSTMDNNRILRASYSAEIMKAEYLKEFSRYVHSKLDDSINDFVPDNEFSSSFKDGWIKLIPLSNIINYREQSSIEPDIKNVKLPPDFSEENIRNLYCQAWKFGGLIHPRVDGYLENRRVRLASGLSIIKISQYFSNKQTKDWKSLLSIATKYLNLAQFTSPYFWFEKIKSAPSYDMDIYFVRNDVKNIRYSTYYDYILQLFKTMILNFNGPNVVNYKNFENDIAAAKSIHKLFEISQKRNVNKNGFVLNTQISSIIDHAKKIDGATFSMSVKDNKSTMSIKINVDTKRLFTLTKEIDYLFERLINLKWNLKKSSGKTKGNTNNNNNNNSTNNNDDDEDVTLILSIAYYLYNSMAVSNGNDLVVYIGTLGLLASFQKTFKHQPIPGKLYDMEAILAGSAQSFGLIFKQNCGKLINTGDLNKVENVDNILPNVRSVLEFYEYDDSIDVVKCL